MEAFDEMKPVQNRAEQLERLLRERIVILDGAMGTMVQQHKLDEAAYRGDRFRHSRRDLQGLHDLLCLTQPHIVEDIHRQYLEAGADLIETNTLMRRRFRWRIMGWNPWPMRSMLPRLGAPAARQMR